MLRHIKRFASGNRKANGKEYNPFPKDLFKTASPLPKHPPYNNKNITSHNKNLMGSTGMGNIKVTADQPKAIKAIKNDHRQVLARDFIHDSLYNPEYGYFSKRAIIFSFPQDVEFNGMKDLSEFDKTVKGLYDKYDDLQVDEALQVWHTPTELFKVRRLITHSVLLV
jgi:hypothetical protein